jgi:hypothetical protein
MLQHNMPWCAPLLNICSLPMLKGGYFMDARFCACSPQALSSAHLMTDSRQASLLVIRQPPCYYVR